eukprot:1182448-Prorocentrum_minimum.AAC.27
MRRGRVHRVLHLRHQFSGPCSYPLPVPASARRVPGGPAEGRSRPTQASQLAYSKQQRLPCKSGYPARCITTATRRSDDSVWPASRFAGLVSHTTWWAVGIRTWFTGAYRLVAPSLE